MAKITRTTHKIFGATGGSSYYGEFGSAKAGTPVNSRDLATIMSLGAWSTGWQDALVATVNGNAPCLEEENSVMFVHSTQMAYIFQEGIPEWDSGTTYWKNSIVKLPLTLGGSEGNPQLFASLIDTNLGNQPPAGANNANWEWINPPTVKDGGLTLLTLPKVSAIATATTPAVLSPSSVSEDGSNVILAKALKFPDTTVQSTASQPPVSSQVDCIHPSVIRVKNNTYQNTTSKPKFVCVTLSQAATAGTATSTAYCDANATPTTVVGAFVTSSSSSDVTVGARIPVFFIALPGYYYKITGSGTVQSWIEWQ